MNSELAFAAKCIGMIIIAVTLLILLVGTSVTFVEWLGEALDVEMATT